ncbi:MAG: hypothetical protein V8Q36_10230 [Anaerotignum sp.]
MGYEVEVKALPRLMKFIFLALILYYLSHCCRILVWFSRKISVPARAKNGITVTAGAEVTDEGIWFEYYVLSDETVAETNTEHRISMITIPYGYFRWDDVPEAEYYQQRY